MNYKPALVLFALATLTAQTIADPALVKTIRDKVLENSERMPRYTCVENISRQRYRPRFGIKPVSCPLLIAAREKLTSPGQLVWQDRLKLDVAATSAGEIFSWAGARQFETTNIDELISNGASGSGDFSSFIHNIFAGGSVDPFQYQGEKDTPSGRFALFTYKIQQEKSRYMFRVPGSSPTIIPFKGEFLANPASGDLARLVVDADDFPPGEVCHLVQAMEYQRVRIGASEFTLPSVTTMTALYLNGEETRNETRFTQCREYVGESTISFGEPGETSTAAQIAVVKPQPLPKDLRLRVTIDPPIRAETAAAGDMISAIVTNEIKQNNQTLVKKGDKLRGRLLRADQLLLPSSRWTFTLKFDTIERNGVEQPISLEPLDDGERLDRITSPQELANARARTDASLQRPDGAGVFILYKNGNITLDKDFRTEWRTK